MKSVKYKEFSNKEDACKWLNEYKEKVNLPMAILGITESNAVIPVYYIDIE